MTTALVGNWYVLYATLTWVTPISFLVWASWLYVLFLSQGSRRGILELSRAERRRLPLQVMDERPSHRRWVSFRAKHLNVADAVQRAMHARIAAPLWIAIACGAGCLALAAFFMWASFAETRNASGAPALALGFFSVVPMLATVLLRRRLWMWRARTEWQVVLLCDRLAQDAAQKVDQDFIIRRTGRILAALARRLPAGRGTVSLEEHHRWARALQQSVALRAELVIADCTERRNWAAWVASWNDSVAAAFHPTCSQRGALTATAADGIERRDIDSQGLTWLIVVCCLFSTFGVILASLSDGGLQLRVMWEWWDSAAGRATTAISGAGGFLGILAYFRSRPASSY
jgi:hypothetical protein